MASLVASLDSHTAYGVGENGHSQYTWSHSLKEKLLQFSFQLTRCDKEVIRNRLAYKFAEILKEVPVTAIDGENYFLTLIVQMIAHTRDIINGKGEYELSYMMVYELHAFYPELAKELLEQFVVFEYDESVHPYGSWKDIKYFCNYVREMKGELHPMIIHAHTIALEQLKLDEFKYNNHKTEDQSSISLVSRWLPREKSKKFGWQFAYMAEKYYSVWMTNSPGPFTPRGKAARNKCYTYFRRLLSKLNGHLDTVQIKQSGNKWSEINHANVTSITLRRQNKALRNVKPNCSDERSDSEDRRKCAMNFSDFFNKSVKDKVGIKGKRISLDEFVRNAISSNDNMDKDILNMQWNDNSNNTGCLPNMIPMIDTSSSMTCDNSVPLFSAVGLGIRITEKSKLKNRAMTFSSNPRWIKYDDCNGFTEKVKKTMNSNDWGFNTNFTAALKLILSAIEEEKLMPEDVSDMVLVILSDMQIDHQGNEPVDKSMYAHIERLYAECGMRVHGCPYKPPSILFWNLRSTTGFPTLSTQENVFMMSGSSPALLNMFCEKGIDALCGYTPWKMFVETVNHTRYESVKTFTDAFIYECERS